MTDQQRIAEIEALCDAAQTRIAKVSGVDLTAPGISISIYNDIAPTCECNLRKLAGNANQYIPFLLSQLAAKDAEIEQLREAQRWIPVTERLPDEGQRVLVWNCASNPSHVATFTSGGRPENMWHYNDGYDDPACWVDGVTHWMPLPSAEGLHDEV